MTNSYLQNAKILIVDDKESNINLLEDLLTESGYHHNHAVTDSRLVAGLVNTFKPDLILLDLMMPHLDGFEVMAQLKTLVPKNEYLPILVLTADISVETKIKALSIGAKDFLSKPFNLYEVRLRIENLLETRYLHQQLNNQNQILEEKVKERTKELELTNHELTIARDKALESDRLKTAFLNNISHEIRTPLNGILGFASLVIQPDITIEEKDEFLEILNSSGTRLINTITDIMDMSLIISGNMEVHPKPTVISSLLMDVFMDFQKLAAKKNLEFNIQFPEDADQITLHTDEELLRKAVSKLVDNAVKFTKEGSIILGFERISNAYEIFVKDTGIGIENDAQKLVYENFRQENVSNTRGHEGSGLGLSITRGMMQLLGGQVRLESAKNMGTTAFLTLAFNTIPTSVKPENTTIAIDGKMPIILIAEDDDNNFLYAETLLRKDAKILRAYNGQEAVDLCRKHPDISLALMDIKMPVMGGIEATYIIKSFRNDMPIIALTAYAQSGDEFKIKEAGCDDYLSKPFNETELLNFIQKYFKK
jgi:two-component system sensor histidine kinase/response regulator